MSADNAAGGWMDELAEIREELREIAETKMADLNANDVDHAMRIIAGTARSMGIEVTD